MIITKTIPLICHFLSYVFCLLLVLQVYLYHYIYLYHIYAYDVYVYVYVRMCAVVAFIICLAVPFIQILLLKNVKAVANHHKIGYDDYIQFLQHDRGWFTSIIVNGKC